MYYQECAWEYPLWKTWSCLARCRNSLMLMKGMCSHEVYTIDKKTMNLFKLPHKMHIASTPHKGEKWSQYITNDHQQIYICRRRHSRNTQSHTPKRKSGYSYLTGCGNGLHTSRAVTRKIYGRHIAHGTSSFAHGTLRYKSAPVARVALHSEYYMRNRDCTRSKSRHVALYSQAPTS